MDMSKFREIYLSEAEDHLQMLNDNLLLLEKDSENKDILEELMRSSHTLKGSSAAMGFNKTAFLTHVMEDVFDDARNGKLNITSKVMDVFFSTVDELEKNNQSIKDGKGEIDVENQANILKEITGVKTEDVGRSGNKKEEANAVVKESEKLKKDDVEKVKDTKIEYVKVPVERLNRLMSLLEELLIDKMKIVDLAKELPKLRSVSDHLDRLVSDLQYQVMQSRMVPMDQIFARFPRLVRDTANLLNKKIEFQVKGGDMELDRTIVDKLAEPLIHLLKNAVDHGIEEEGSIYLSAIREKDFAIIVVEDDGKGIDYDRVRKVAVENNIISEELAQKMDESSLANLIYDSRFSTSETITETSGRGIGLSVVKNFVEQNGGRVDVISPSMGDKGTRFKMELPASIAIVNTLIVEVKGALFAIPFSVIERTIRVERGDIKGMADRDMVVVDEEGVPLIHLDKLFSETVAGTDLEVDKETDLRSRLIVIVNKGEEKVGLVVDSLRDELEVIIKPLPAVLKNAKGFSGSTILGDGRTILIIDALSLFK